MAGATDGFGERTLLVRTSQETIFSIGSIKWRSRAAPAETLDRLSPLRARVHSLIRCESFGVGRPSRTSTKARFIPRSARCGVCFPATFGGKAKAEKVAPRLDKLLRPLVWPDTRKTSLRTTPKRRRSDRSFVQEHRFGREAAERPILMFEDVYKSYRVGTPVLRGTNLVIERGEFVFITGPSGAGKSTLCLVFSTEQRPWTMDAFSFSEKTSRALAINPFRSFVATLASSFRTSNSSKAGASMRTLQSRLRSAWHGEPTHSHTGRRSARSRRSWRTRRVSCGSSLWRATTCRHRACHCK